MPVMIIIWLIFFPKLLNPIINVAHFIRPEADSIDKLCTQPYLQADDNSKKKLGLWIKSNTDPRERVYVAGYGSIVQAYSERQSPSIFFNVTQTESAKKQLFTDLGTNKPFMIVIPVSQEYTYGINSDIRLFIDSLVIRNYSFIRCIYGYGVYGLRR